MRIGQLPSPRSPLGDVRDVTVMAKGFAGIYVGNVHLDAWDIDAGQRIAQRHTGMGKGRRIDNDELGAIGARLMNRLDHFLLAVALQAVRLPHTLGFGLQAMVNLVQRFQP